MLTEKQKAFFFGRSTLRKLPTEDWLSGTNLNVVSALARVEALSEESPDDCHLLDDSRGYFLSHKSLSELTDSQARSFGLPSTVPFQLRIALNGPMARLDSKILATWHSRAGRRENMEAHGALLTAGDSQYRIPGSLYRILNSIRAVNGAKTTDDRISAVSSLKDQLLDETGSEFDVDRQIDDINLMHASSVSLELSVSAAGVEFDPVLFSEEAINSAGGEVVKETDQLISPELRGQFCERFRSESEVKDAYVIARNQYVFIDPSLRSALSVVKQVQESSPEEKQRFAKSPQSFIKAALTEKGIEDEAADQIVETSFVETDGFSERVLEIGVWKPPVLPFVKRNPNTWVPEGFGLKIGTESYVIPETAVRTLAEKIVEALKSNQGFVELPEVGQLVPATEQSLAAANALLERVMGQDPVPFHAAEGSGEDVEDDDQVIVAPVTHEKSVLKVQENFISSEFTAKFEPRAEFEKYEGPEGFLNTPKTHQVEGIEWMQRCWSLGFPGVLLADDMGLGKTFQTLGFMSWLRHRREQLRLHRSPVLIVAPTTLLGNWEKEASMHISGEYLGDLVLLYGSNVKNLRLPGVATNDVVAGAITLDTSELKSADWILTTYETMRDNHISLATIPFSCVVFDEMQKIKNPKSMMTNAAQALNSEYVIGLTGTPIENSLADLWTLFDTLMPGAMGWGDLRSFLEHYTEENQDRLRQLKEYLQLGQNGSPPPMLRRMKSEVAKDLPSKIERILDAAMSDDQAKRYREAILHSQQSTSRKDKLAAFQSIRGISLHPYYPDSEKADDAEYYVRASARLNTTIEILDQVHMAGEKALVFIESIAMHEWLSFYLKARYNLPQKPGRIYGSVTSVERSNIVDRFQSESNIGFDVLLLSPKAAGVGITLTAATNVIHLSRWWNPAVEDQCTDRAYRIGQLNDVHVYIPRAIHPLYGEGSFDCVLHQLLENKRLLSSEMLIPLETGNEMDQMFEAMSAIE